MDDPTPPPHAGPAGGPNGPASAAPADAAQAQIDLAAETSPGTRLPDALRRHLLVADRHYFVLPEPLLEGLMEAAGGAHQFDPDALSLDRAAAAACAGHDDVVGFHDGTAVDYDLLAPPPPAGAIADVLRAAAADGDPAFAWVTPAAEAAAADADGHAAWVRRARRGFAGWLALDPAFAAEQAAFFARWGDVVAGFGLRGTPVTDDDVLRALDDPTSEGARYVRFAIARDAFLRRWHLTGLAGPFLPRPPSPQFPLAAAPAVAAAVLPLGTTLFWPAILPLPDRDRLRRMAEGALYAARGAAARPPHLAGWLDLVEADTQGKKAVDRLGRVFVLQHYWRVAHARHAAALGGRRPAVIRAFARFLIPDLAGKADEEVERRSDAVRKDLDDIAAARGDRDWYLRPSPYDAA